MRRTAMKFGGGRSNNFELHAFYAVDSEPGERHWTGGMRHGTDVCQGKV